jgi:hypothetical protein
MGREEPTFGKRNYGQELYLYLATTASFHILSNPSLIYNSTLYGSEKTPYEINDMGLSSEFYVFSYA